MKTILITGANGQLGSFLAKQYHAEDQRLALLYHQRSERIQELINCSGVWSKAVDLRSYNGVEQAIGDLEIETGHSPDILIHCAALRSFDAKPLAETDPATFWQVFNTNMESAYNVLRAVLQSMQEKRWGRVVLLGSDVTNTGLKYGSAYAAAKSAMVSLMRSSAPELAPEVLINAISPGPIDTVLEEDYEGEYLRFRQEYFAAFKEQVPTKELIQLREIKHMIDLLISEDMVNLTGEELFIRGGLK